jgi:FixJ family two-component response regulator
MRKRALRVAIVDDDTAVRKSLARLLTVRSFEVESCMSASAFLDVLPSGVPDCLVLDLQMPGMTGLELQHELARRGVHIPTVVITAHDDPGLLDRCRIAGAAAILFKPIDADRLATAIEAACKVQP